MPTLQSACVVFSCNEKSVIWWRKIFVFMVLAKTNVVLIISFMLFSLSGV